MWFSASAAVRYVLRQSGRIAIPVAGIIAATSTAAAIGAPEPATPADHIKVPTSLELAGSAYAGLEPESLKQAKWMHDQATSEATSMDAPGRQALLGRALATVEDVIASGGALSTVNQGSAWRWKGTILSALTSYMSTKESIAASPLIRDAWTRAAELNPRDASAMHLLGRWCLKMASLSWVERTAASLLFGTPPSATMEEALAWFERAETADPGFWLANQVKLASTLAYLGRVDEANEWALTASRLPVATEDDEASRKELEEVALLYGWSLPAVHGRA